MQRRLNRLYSFITSRFNHDEVAITFDDLPCYQNDPIEQQRLINERILQALQKYNIPAIGFVNEGKLYKGDTQEKIAILKSWIDYGQLLGNHSFSHKVLSKETIDEYEKDVIKGELISKQLMTDAGKPYRYFRHPYLDTGKTKEIHATFESFLKKRGYIVAPATVNSNDWIFNLQLLKNPQNKEEILKKYLAFTKLSFDYYKDASEQLFGRNIKHIWLLHVNLINSYAMEELIKIVTELGYQFITLDQALEDKAYQEPDTCYGQFGGSWLYRWDHKKGKVIDWSENNPFIKTLSFIFFDESRKRSIPIELYFNIESIAKAQAGVTKFSVAIINHAESFKNTEYTCIANALISASYFVVSIQHNLEDDPELPTADKLERGVQNILFTISELSTLDPNLNLEKVTLIGHSNGGDMAMMFTEKHPELVEKTILLDSHYHPTPSKNQIPVLLIRKNDSKDDASALSETGIKVVTLETAENVELYDHAPAEVLEQINKTILEFLKDS